MELRICCLSLVKGVTALAVDPSGARVATGGFDYQVNLYDFGGMDSRFRPFRSLEPCGSHQVRELPSGTLMCAVD